MANAFFVRCDCRNRRFTGGKSRFLQEADGRKGIASAADELCGSALIKEINFLYFTFSQKLYRKSIFFFHRKNHFLLSIAFFHIYLLYDR